MSWDSFASATRLIELGEQAAMAAMPTIWKWLAQPSAPPVGKLETRGLPHSIRST
jgi:hypothetical protein